MKKKNNKTILPFVAVGILGTVTYLFWPKIKTIFKKSGSDENEPVIGPSTNNTGNSSTGGSGSSNNSSGGGTSTKPTGKLSPLGTPKNKINLDVNLKRGDFGQEVAKLQQILNDIARMWKLAGVQEDGEFGQGTESKLKQIYGQDSINLYKAYTMLYAIYIAKKGKKSKDWYKTFGYFLTKGPGAEARQRAMNEYQSKNVI
jgi:hypothetical protein